MNLFLTHRALNQLTGANIGTRNCTSTTALANRRRRLVALLSTTSTRGRRLSSNEEDSRELSWKTSSCFTFHLTRRWLKTYTVSKTIEIVRCVLRNATVEVSQYSSNLRYYTSKKTNLKTRRMSANIYHYIRRIAGEGGMFSVVCVCGCFGVSVCLSRR